MTVLRMLAFRPEGGAPVLPKPAAKTQQRAAPSAPGARRAATGWPELVQQLSLSGAARELARHAELLRREGNTFELLVPKAKAYLAERSYTDKLRAALEQHAGGTVVLKVGFGDSSGVSAAALEAGERAARHAAATQSVQSDGFVKDLVDMFDAKVVDSSIKSDGK